MLKTLLSFTMLSIVGLHVAYADTLDDQIKYGLYQDLNQNISAPIGLGDSYAKIKITPKTIEHTDNTVTFTAKTELEFTRKSAINSQFGKVYGDTKYTASYVVDNGNIIFKDFSGANDYTPSFTRLGSASILNPRSSLYYFKQSIKGINDAASGKEVSLKDIN